MSNQREMDIPGKGKYQVRNKETWKLCIKQCGKLIP